MNEENNGIPNEFPMVRMAKIKKTDKTKCWLRHGTLRTLMHCCGDVKWEKPLWKIAWQFLVKLNTHLPYNTGIPRMSTKRFVCISFTCNTQTEKQHVSITSRMHTLGDTHTTEHNSVTKWSRLQIKANNIDESQNIVLSPGQRTPLVGASPCTPKGCGFDS